jgi:hypothetical protein
MFYIIAIVAAIFAMPASAQSLKERLVGTWTLASCNAPDFLPCAGSNGIQVFDASGHYVTMIAARGRPKVPISRGAAGANRNEPTPERYKSVASGVMAQFGTRSLNEANKMIMIHPEGPLFPNIEGTDWATFTISISGDEMRGIGQDGQPGPFVWRRIAK